MNHKRVVITGMGIVSNIGNSLSKVQESLLHGNSGITFNQSFQDHGFSSQVSGFVPENMLDDKIIPTKSLRFMGQASKYAYHAMQESIKSSHLTESLVSNPNTGVIIGSGGTSVEALDKALILAKKKQSSKIGPFWVPITMSSGVSASLSVSFKIKGMNISISSACTTSTHAIIQAYDAIRLGRQKIIFAGGAEEGSWQLSLLFDAMGALSSKYNADPTKASRPYDKNRDGFVIAGGAGVVVVEDLDHALKRNAPIFAEIVGTALNNDGDSMVAPNGIGATDCMREALDSMGNKPIDYINTHGTSTIVGDLSELQAIKNVFSSSIPPISSTKSMTGHSLGAVGAQEVIYSILMLQNNFIAPSINIEEIDPQCAQYPIIKNKAQSVELNRILKNNFGFGGTNGTIILEKFK